MAVLPGGVDVAITHKFVSGKADGADPTLVQPSKWNQNENLGAGADGNHLVRDSAQTDGGSWLNYLTASLLNKTGAANAAGDVVAIDTANDSAVVLDDTVSSLKRYVVALQTPADAAVGAYGVLGPIPGVKAQGAIARGQYVRKSATTKAVEDAGVAMSATNVPPNGALGIALTAAAAGVVTVMWFGATQGAAVATVVLGQNVFTGRQEWKQGADIASAATVNLATDGNYWHITGTTTITAFGTLPQAGCFFAVEFTGILTLTNNASIILGGGANITTAAGMVILFVSEGAGVVRQVAPASTVSGAGTGVTVLDRVSADTSVSSTTVETTVYTKSIPGNTLSTNIRLRLTLQCSVQGDAAVADTITVRCKYGATTLVSPTAQLSDGATGVPANTAFRLEFLLSGDNATNAQLGMSHIVTLLPGGTAAQSIQRGTSAEDSTAAKTLLVSVQHSGSSATDKFVMEHAILEQL